MDPEHTTTGICLSYCSFDAGFAQKLVIDLQNAGFNISTNMIDNIENGDAVSELYRVFNTCSVFLPICSVAFANIMSWKHLKETATSSDIQMIPILTQQCNTSDVFANEQTVDFSYWRNGINYKNSLEKLKTIIKVRFPELVSQKLDSETQYINLTLTNIELYKSQLMRISSRLDSLPTDKSAVYSQSMWGLTGAFEIIRDDKGNSTSVTDTFYKILEDYPRFLLLGCAGVGKTTTLYRTTLDVLRAYKADKENFPLPYLLHLQEWHENVSFDTFLQSHWPFEDDPSEVLPQGRVFVLLDGLDEVGYPQHDKILSLRAWLNGSTGPKYAILACDLEANQLTEDIELPQVRLRELDLPSVKQYVFSHLDKNSSQNLLSQLSTDVIPNDNLSASLAYNLLNLAIMVSIIANDDNAHIPDNKAEFLFWETRMLWHMYNSTNVSFEDSFVQLSFLAFSMINDGMSSFVPYSYAIEKVPDPEILQMALNAGILWMRNDKSIGFWHLLFRDCYATYHLLIYEGIYTRLRQPQFTIEGQKILWKWDRPLIFASALADNSDQVIGDIAEVNPCLALECIFSGVDVDYATKKSVIEKLIYWGKNTNNAALREIVYLFEKIPNKGSISVLLEHLPSRVENRKRDEGEIMPLKKLGSDVVKFLTEVLHGEKWERRKGAAWMLGELNVHAAIPGLIDALSDENESVRKEADYALARIGKPALPHLLKALQSNDTDLRANVIKVLGRIGDPTTVSDLVACLTDISWPHREEVRICDLASVALEYIGTDSALDAVDSWKEQLRTASTNSALHAKVKTSQQKVSGHEKSRKQLIESLKDKDWSVRRNAIQSLGESGDRAALSHILSALKDEDSHVRWMAVKTLSQFSGKEVLSGLVDALHDDDYLICDAAASALREIGTDAAPALIEALSNGNVNVRGNAAEVLGQIKSESAIPHLVDMLEDKSVPRWEGKRICDIAADALKQIGTEQALLALNRWREEQQQQMLSSAFGENQVSLLHLDSLSQDTEEISSQKAILLTYLDNMEGSDWKSRQEATEALQNYAKQLKEIGNIDISSDLGPALTNKNTVIRWSAVEALIDFGTESVPFLIEALDDDNWTIKITAIRSLIELESSEAIPRLLELINDENQMVRQTAITALGNLGDTSTGTHLLDILNDKDEFVRKAAAEALGELKSIDAVPKLLTTLENDTTQVKLTVIEALGKIGSSEAIPALTKYLDDMSQPDWEDRRVCDIVVEALEQIDDQQAQTALEKWRVRQLR